MQSQLILVVILCVGLLTALLYRYRDIVLRAFYLKLSAYLIKLQKILSNENLKQRQKETILYKANFESLAPTDDADKNGKYSEALKWAINQDSIQNIAVTGPFGAGKTSVLKTFEKRNPELEILNISLASFSQDISQTESKPEPSRYFWGVSKSRDEEKRQREYLIEKSILQQIIYSETGKKLPMSRFERLSKVSRYNSWAKIIASIFLIISGLILLKLDSKTIVNFINTFTELDLGKQLFSFIILVGVIYSASLLLKELLKNKNVNKVSLLKGDIELSEKTGASILNLHIDEIIYFFEETEYEVVVFEDLDRFDGIDIFTKLREINTLLNHSKQLAGNKVVFIYAVKDDIFDEVSRTKFFDFIVPVIPVVNSSNSKNILLNKLKTTPYGASFSDKFVSDITLYVDDMRLILNIFNEYIIYSENLTKQIDLGPQKLLAFIVYKNKYPSDFSLLNKGRGVVADAFEKKNQIILEISKKIDEDIQKAQADIHAREELIKNEIAKSSEELRSLYLFKFLEKMPLLQYIVIDNVNVPLMTFLEEGSFNKLINDTGRLAYYQGRRAPRPSFDEIQKEVDPERTYSERLDLITKNEDKILDNLYANLEKLKAKKANLKGQPLAYLLAHFPDRKVELLGKQSNDRLLSYLLTNSWIDEGYYNYLSYFYPGSRTPQDVNFLLAVNEKKQLPITYKITSHKEILKQLTSHELSSKYALNLDLLDYMYSVSSDRLGEYLLNFEKFSSDDFEFVYAFNTYSEYGQEFITNLAETWDSFIQEILIKSTLPEDDKCLLLKYIFTGCKTVTILSQNKNDVISNYISSSETRSKFLLSVDVKKSTEIITKLKPKFSKLALFTSLPELFNHIVNHECYSINQENLKCIFDYYQLNYQENIPTYSDIIQVDTPLIIKYIRNNLNTFVQNVVLESSERLYESEDSLVKLFNHPMISSDNIEKMIIKLNFSLNDIASVNENLWPSLLKYKKIKPSWHNIFQAYSNEEVTSIHDELWQYLNDENVSQALSELTIPEEDYSSDSSLTHNFFLQLIQIDSINSQNIENLIKAFSFNVEDLSSIDLPPNSAHALIEAGKVILTNENLKILRDKSVDDVEKILVENIVDICDEDSQVYQIETNELMSLLVSAEISRERKLEIIAKYQDLFLGEVKLQHRAWELIKDGYPFIPLSDELILEMIAWLPNINEKGLLISTQVEQRTWESLSSLLKNTGIQSFQQIAAQKRFIKLESTVGTSKLADELYSQQYISSYSDETDKSDDEEYIKVNSKRRKI